MLRPPPLAPLGGTRNARLVAPCGRHGRAVVRTWVCKPWLCGELGSVADRKSGSLLRPPPLAPLRRTGNAALIALHGRHGRPVSRHWVHSLVGRLVLLEHITSWALAIAITIHNLWSAV